MGGDAASTPINAGTTPTAHSAGCRAAPSLENRCPNTPPSAASTPPMGAAITRQMAPSKATTAMPAASITTARHATPTLSPIVRGPWTPCSMAAVMPRPKGTPTNRPHPYDSSPAAETATSPSAPTEVTPTASAALPRLLSGTTRSSHVGAWSPSASGAESSGTKESVANRTRLRTGTKNSTTNHGGSPTVRRRRTVSHVPTAMNGSAIATSASTYVCVSGVSDRIRPAPVTSR